VPALQPELTLRQGLALWPGLGLGFGLRVEQAESVQQALWAESVQKSQQAESVLSAESVQ